MKKSSPVQRRRMKNRFLPMFFLIVLLAAAIGISALTLNKAENSTKPAGNNTGSSPAQNAASQGGSTPTNADRNAWNMLLVNQDNPLSTDYVPTTKELPNGLKVDERIYQSLTKMMADAKSQGLDLVVCSAYRPRELQEKLFKEQVTAEMANGHSESEATALAGTTVAVPGTSEHQTGLSVDIVALSYQLLDEKVMETPEVKWLYKNCQNYGFIVRYPDGKSEITKIIYEPWHYRYVGVEAAKEIMSQGITLEEYLSGK